MQVFSKCSNRECPNDRDIGHQVIRVHDAEGLREYCCKGCREKEEWQRTEEAKLKVVNW